MTMRRNDEAGRKFEAEDEWPLLCRAAQQDGGLRACRQGRRSRAPLDGVAGHDGVMLLSGLRLRDPADDRGGAQQQAYRRHHGN